MSLEDNLIPVPLVYVPYLRAKAKSEMNTRNYFHPSFIPMQHPKPFAYNTLRYTVYHILRHTFCLGLSRPTPESCSPTPHAQIMRKGDPCTCEVAWPSLIDHRDLQFQVRFSLVRSSV